MLDYKTLDKTGWFIEQMKSGSFSRQEIVAIAAKEFPNIPVKTLDGTIGQYWSDSVNPKWGTYKAIQARGLRVVENGGKRTIVEGSGTFAEPAANDRTSPLKAFSAPLRQVADTQGRGDGTREMWNTNDPGLWQTALTRYWTFVKASNLELEKEMERLDAATVKAMNPKAWFQFLLEKYFRWKYTAPNRYGSTTKMLRAYAANNELAGLHAVKDRLFAADKDNIEHDGLMKLRPVTFRYKQAASDGSKPLQYGLIAEEVEQVYPDAVSYNKKGEPYAVQYHKINAMLLNELQKQKRENGDQHREIDELKASIAELKAAMTGAPK